jgi:hypothetical protein
MRMGASINHPSVGLTMHSLQHYRLVRPTRMRAPRLAYSPEVPFSPAASILRVKWFPSESLPEQIRMRRIGETENPVGSVVAVHGVPALAE